MIAAILVHKLATYLWNWGSWPRDQDPPDQPPPPPDSK